MSDRSIAAVVRSDAKKCINCLASSEWREVLTIAAVNTCTSWSSSGSQREAAGDHDVELGHRAPRRSWRYGRLSIADDTQPKTRGLLPSPAAWRSLPLWLNERSLRDFNLRSSAGRRRGWRVSVELTEIAIRRKHELFGVALRAPIDALGRHLVGGRLDIGQIHGSAAMVTGRQKKRVDIDSRCAIHNPPRGCPTKRPILSYNRLEVLKVPHAAC